MRPGFGTLRFPIEGMVAQAGWALKSSCDRLRRPEPIVGNPASEELGARWMLGWRGRGTGCPGSPGASGQRWLSEVCPGKTLLGRVCQTTAIGRRCRTHTGVPGFHARSAALPGACWFDGVSGNDVRAGHGAGRDGNSTSSSLLNNVAAAPRGGRRVRENAAGGGLCGVVQRPARAARAGRAGGSGRVAECGVRVSRRCEECEQE